MAEQREGRWQQGDPNDRTLKVFDPHRQERSDSADAFIPDPGEGPAVVDEELAESMAENFVRAATSTGETDEQSRDELTEEELGGPFVQTSAAEEFAIDDADDLPPDSTREPLPQAVAGLVQMPEDDEAVDAAVAAGDDDVDLDDDEDT